MSALIFVRDGRTLPYIPITTAALDALRAVCKDSRDDGRKRSYPHALAVYVALLELANDDRTDRVAISHTDIGERAGCGRATAQLATYDLVAARLLVVREIAHGRGRIENEYVAIEPGQTEAKDIAPPHVRNATPARQKCSPQAPVPSGPSDPQGYQDVEEKEAPTAREDVRLLCEQLASRVTGNGYSVSDPLAASWQTPMRQLLDRDHDPKTGAHWTAEQVAHVIDHATSDPFWMLNVRSPSSLRKHFERFVIAIRAASIPQRVDAKSRARMDYSKAQVERFAERERAARQAGSPLLELTA